jgi:hypothetical protein
MMTSKTYGCRDNLGDSAAEVIARKTVTKRKAKSDA